MQTVFLDGLMQGNSSMVKCRASLHIVGAKLLFSVLDLRMANIHLLPKHWEKVLCLFMSTYDPIPLFIIVYILIFTGTRAADPPWWTSWAEFDIPQHQLPNDAWSNRRTCRDVWRDQMSTSILPILPNYVCSKLFIIHFKEIFLKVK